MDETTSQNSSLENKLAKAILDDRRRERRWRNIRFFTWLIIIIVILLLLFAPQSSQVSADNKPYVSLVQLNGMIMPGTNLAANRFIPVLNKAFSDSKAKGVVLLVNSPGGSAVQSAIIHDKIMQLKEKYKKKVVVVGEDAVASGAYMVATAADKIYVNEATLTGSIGVIFPGFGLTDLMQKVGVTRRVFTAGENKDRLDPFEPLKPNDVVKIQQVLDQVHQSFIEYVKAGRKGKLTGDEKELFSGDFWIGKEALKLGLVDGTADLWKVMKDEFGVETYKQYSVKPSLYESLFKGIDSALHLNLTNRSTGFSEVMQTNSF